MFTREKQEMKRVPMMPVRDMVIFPQQMTPFIVGREASVRALEEALAGDKKIFLSTQHDASVDDPKPKAIYAGGTLANVARRLQGISGIQEIEMEKLNVNRNINTRVKKEMERAQKDYYLNEKLKGMQKELGRCEKSELDELKKKLDSAGMPKEVHEKATAELK